MKGVEMVKCLVMSGLFSASSMQMVQNQSNSSLSNSSMQVWLSLAQSVWNHNPQWSHWITKVEIIWLLPHTEAMFTVTSNPSSSLTDSMREVSCVLIRRVLLVLDPMGMVFMSNFHPIWFIRLAAGPPNLGLPRLLLTKLF